MNIISKPKSPQPKKIEFFCSTYCISLLFMGSEYEYETLSELTSYENKFGGYAH